MGAIRTFFRIIDSTVRSFLKDDCYNKASTLTFYTLQSIIPFFAFLFGIAKGFGFEEYLKNLSTTIFHEQQEIINYAVKIALEMLQHIQGGVIVGFGVLFLIWTTLNLLEYIEKSFNEIWKVKTPRSLLRKFSDYLAAILICPLIVIVSSSMTVYVKTQLSQFEGNIVGEALSAFASYTVILLPWVLSWIVFFFLYYLIPNSKRQIWPKVVAAIVAGSLFQLWQVAYIYLQVRVFSYNVVYGAFAALPLFFIWVQWSWLIALAGAELAAQIENGFFLGSKSHEKKISNKQLALLILYHCFEPYQTCKLPLTHLQISKKIKAPLDAVQKMIDILVQRKILIEIKTEDHEAAYQLLCAPHCFNIKSISDAIDGYFDLDVSAQSNDLLHRVTKDLDTFNQAADQLESNISLEQITKEV